MKFFILFLVCGVMCDDLPVTTVLPVLEPETLTDLPRETIEQFEVTRQNDRVEDNEVTETEMPAVKESISATTQESISATTQHFLEAACTDEHTEWNSCGPRCYQTCSIQPRGVRRSRSVCEAGSQSANGCYPGCYCKSGYVRLNEKCVLPLDCPTRNCMLFNEEHKQCGTPCQITCDSYSRMAEIESRCPADICVRGCFCKSGYVRSATGLCVLPTRCPRPLVN